MSDEQQEWVVDAIEEKSASIELPGGAMTTLPLSALPKGVREGQVLMVTMQIDAAATKRAMDASAAQVKKGRDASRKRDPGGDVAL